ncbi:MAG: YicC family protein [Bacteroidales bacterium]|nr:YicC family protein [Bacteroidales bacterium]
MKSMTGFAKRQCNIGGCNYIVEIKSLNSKQIDANVKLPTRVREHELDIRAMLNRLERGKIDFILTEEQKDGTNACFNSEAATNRLNELKEWSASIGSAINEASLLGIVLQQSDIWNSAVDAGMDEQEWGLLSDTINAAITDLDNTRIHEGGILKTDFEKHVNLIEQYLNEIPKYEAERITTAKERMRSYLNDAAVKDIDENRFEQELIYYLEKLDITEEKVRLAKHINYFREVMDNEEGSGKKLGFIAQEMGREINTTGSKANHVEIQRLVVAMKDELEKIKEQLGNIL